jgi:hypothetical protein
LSQWILEHSTARIFPALVELWARGFPGVALLGAAYRLGAQRAQEGLPLRRVRDLADGLRRHRSYLWRLGKGHGIEVRELIRPAMVLSALSRYSGDWEEVAAILDVSSSAMAHLFRRALGCTRSEATEMTFRELVLWAAAPMRE